ncbi:hypothetical protein [Clostridium sp.]|uniref:hypothetical protein n=1 Tax=Clostridium sp. TaxID=1506 RepID=UPI003F3000A8
MLVREYKKEDLDGVDKVHVDAWISTYSGMIPREYLISRTYEKQQKKWNDRLFNNKNTDEFMFVLENEDKEVVGFGRMLIKAVTEKLVSLGAKKGNSSIINISGVDLIEVEYYWNEINHLTI